jgi:hypothetical protein
MVEHRTSDDRKTQCESLPRGNFPETMIKVEEV